MSEAPPIRIAIVDDHKMLLGALTEWIRGAADDIRMVAAVASWPELLTHPDVQDPGGHCCTTGLHRDGRRHSGV